MVASFSAVHTTPNLGGVLKFLHSGYRFSKGSVSFDRKLRFSVDITISADRAQTITDCFFFFFVKLGKKTMIVTYNLSSSVQ